MRIPRRPAALLLAALLGAAGGAAGQATSPAHQTGLELTVSTQRSLRQIGETSIQWHRAFLQKDEEAAARELETAQEIVRSLRMSSLPDLSLAALVRAVEAAEAGDPERARWALAAAEELDPGQPEAAFAQAAVHRAEGSFLKALIASGRGYLRLLDAPSHRDLWQHNLVLWGLLALMATAAVYLVLSIALKGSVVTLDLTELLARGLPKPVALILSLLLLAAPLFLPFGLLWFLLLWSVLLWGYGSAQERVVLIFIWLMAGSVPLVVQHQLERIQVESSPALRVVHSLERGRLYGRLFTDLGVLETVLPNSTAVLHLKADLHVRLGQWELARSAYGELLDDEPANAAAYNNLGYYFFINEDMGGALRSFESATVADSTNPTTFYNLSQALSALLHLDAARDALEKAQRLEPDLVSSWMQEERATEARLMEGSLQRIPEIREEIRQALAPEEEAASAQLLLVRRGFSLLIGVGVVLIAGALHLARRGFGYSQPSGGLMREGGALDPLLCILVPGLQSSRRGQGILAFLAILPLAALLLVPFAWHWGYRMPWGFDPGNAFPWLVTTLGIFGLLLVRLIVQRALEE